MMKTRFLPPRPLLLLAMLLLILSACSLSALDETATPLPLTSTTAPDPVVTPETPVPAAGVVVLLTPAQGWGEDHAAVEAEVTTRGLVLDVRQEMAPTDAPENLRAVVLFDDAPDAAALLAAFPDIPFLSAFGSSMPSAPNLTVLSSGQSTQPTIQAFMAGYIAAVETTDWRVGFIGINDSAGQEYRRAFTNGMVYFCSMCTSQFPPYEAYPVTAEIAPEAGQPEFEATASQVIARGATLVHTDPRLQTDAFYQYLAAAGMRLIGSAPPPAGLEGSWVVTLISSAGIGVGEALAALLDGSPPPAGSGSLDMTSIAFSEARRLHFAEILARLESGEIDPLGETSP
jgi:hypothetical protein